MKKDSNGIVIQFKMRLVAKGCSQVEGVDFGKTFAIVAKFNIIRIILAIATAMGLELYQMDIKTAFLNGELDVEIYMEQPNTPNYQEYQFGMKNKVVGNHTINDVISYVRVEVHVIGESLKGILDNSCTLDVD